MNQTFDEFRDSVFVRMLAATNDVRFEPSQRELLAKAVSHLQSRSSANDLAQPLALLHLTRQAWGGPIDERAVQVAAAAMLYVCSLDAFDDVQDRDLAGKPLADVDEPIAINSALALMFLSFECLRHGMALEPDDERRLRYLDAFNRASLKAAGGQHGDLMGKHATTAPTQVLLLHEGKTSSVALLLELGALLGGCSPKIVDRYGVAGRILSQLFQVVDDLRDVFGKLDSPDLRGDKVTYPRARFLELASATELACFERLRQALPESLPMIRNLFYDVGVVDACAAKLEELRAEYHRSIAMTENESASNRLLLSLVDAMVETIYVPERLPETARFFAPNDAFSCEFRAACDEFVKNVAYATAFVLPDLVPWHLPHFEYDPERRTLFYPDMDGLASEILPHYRRLHAIENDGDCKALLRRSLVLIACHELFHCLRFDAERATDDRWHEEYVANRLAVAYAQRFCPETLAFAVSDLATVPTVNTHDARAVDAILARCGVPAAEPLAYDTDVVTASVVHARMVRELAALPLEFDVEFATLLGLERVETAVAAE